MANVSTTGTGSGLIIGGDGTQPYPHPFCRLEILSSIKSDEVLYAVQSAPTWMALIRTLTRSGFLLTSPPLVTQSASTSARVQNCYTLWDYWNFSPVDGAMAQLASLAPVTFRKALEATNIVWNVQEELCLETLSLAWGQASMGFHSRWREGHGGLGKHQSVYVDGFSFGKKASALRSRFVSLETGRTIVPTFEGRPLPRCLGFLMPARAYGHGRYRSLGDPTPDSEPVFQHENVSFTEFVMTSMLALRDKWSTQSEITRLYMDKGKKGMKVAEFLHALEMLGVTVCPL